MNSRSTLCVYSSEIRFYSNSCVRFFFSWHIFLSVFDIESLPLAIFLGTSMYILLLKTLRTNAMFSHQIYVVLKHFGVLQPESWRCSFFFTHLYYLYSAKIYRKYAIRNTIGSMTRLLKKRCSLGGFFWNLKVVKVLRVQLTYWKILIIRYLRLFNSWTHLKFVVNSKNKRTWMDCHFDIHRKCERNRHFLRRKYDIFIQIVSFIEYFAWIPCLTLNISKWSSFLIFFLFHFSIALQWTKTIWDAYLLSDSICRFWEIATNAWFEQIELQVFVSNLMKNIYVLIMI